MSIDHTLDILDYIKYIIKINLSVSVYFLMWFLKLLNEIQSSTALDPR